jgi:hypothetical protein
MAGLREEESASGVTRLLWEENSSFMNFGKMKVAKKPLKTKRETGQQSASKRK